MHPDELFVDSQGGASCGESEDAGLAKVVFADDFGLDDFGNGEGGFC